MMPVFASIIPPFAYPVWVSHQIVDGVERLVVWLGWQLDSMLCATLAGNTVSTVTDEQLMASYVDGDDDSFRELFARYSPRLLRSARRKGLSESESQDAVQQTFVHVHQGRFEFNRTSRVAPWIFTIGFNVMRDYGRRASAHWRMKLALRAEPAAPVESATGQADRTAMSEAVIETALAQLSDDQREVITLHYYEEMSFAEIAGVQGCKPGAVRARAHRGYEKLRAILPRLQDREEAE